MEVEVFHMLIERLNGVEDKVRKMRDDLGCILLPRLEDVTVDNVQQLKDKLKEQDVVRALAERRRDNPSVVLHGDLPRNLVRQLKDNGFRVKRAGPSGPHQETTTMILWADAVCDRETLRHVWANPEDFKDL